VPKLSDFLPGAQTPKSSRTTDAGEEPTFSTPKQTQFVVLGIDFDAAKRPVFSLKYAVAIADSDNLLGGGNIISVAPADVREHEYLIIVTAESAVKRGWIPKLPGARIERLGGG
jgi:hypothetical protein